MFVRYSFQQTLQAAFALVAMLAAASAAWVWLGLKNVEAQLVETSDHSTPQLERVNDLKLLVVLVSLEARHAMLAPTPEGRAKSLAEIARLRQESDRVLAAVRANLRTQEGRQLVGAAETAKDAFWRAAGELVPLIETGDDAAGFEVLERSVVPARQAYLDAVDAQGNSQKELLDRSIDSALHASERAQRLLLLFSALVTGLGVWLALLLLR